MEEKIDTKAIKKEETCYQSPELIVLRDERKVQVQVQRVEELKCNCCACNGCKGQVGSGDNRYRLVPGLYVVRHCSCFFVAKNTQKLLGVS